MEEYEKAKVFWDNVDGLVPYNANQKIITDPYFNNIISHLYNEKAKVLDFGCGTGWGIFELYNTRKFRRGIGVDQAGKCIKYAVKCVKLTGLVNIVSFKQRSLEQLKSNAFDAIFTCNTLDTVPPEVAIGFLKELQRVLKKGHRLVVSLNPYLSQTMLKKLNMTSIGNNMYTKNGILRCVNLRNLEWERIMSDYFQVEEIGTYVVPSEKGWKRRLFVLKKIVK